MTFKLGEVTFTDGHTSGGARLGKDTRSYAIQINPGSLEAATAMSHQLRGQVGDLVAVTWSDDPEIDGMYIVEDCTVSPIANYLATGLMTCNVALRLEGDVIETEHLYSFDNAVSLTPPYNYMTAVHGYYPGVPDSTYLHDNDPFVLSEHFAIASPDNTPAFLPYGDEEYPALLRTQLQQGVDPSLYGVGRARIEVRAVGSLDWWTLTGTRVPENHDLRVSNGMVRVTVVAGEAYLLQEIWFASTSSWVESARFLFSSDAVSYGFVRRWLVFRNDHAEISVRCHLVYPSDRRSFYLDLSLQRGVGMVRALLTVGFMGGPVTSQYCEIQEYDGTAMATTAVSTDGLKRTANIAASNGPYLFGDDANSTPSTATDRVVYSSKTYGHFGLGSTIDGSGSTTGAISWWRTHLFMADMVVR